MAEAVLAALLRQALWLGFAAVVLLALRRPALHRFGAGLAYARWALLPLVLLADALPVTESVRVVTADVVRQIGPAVHAQSLVLPQTPASTAKAWLALWLAGAALLLALMLWQQLRLLRGLARDGGQWWAAPGEGPALVGLLRPRLVLPRDFAERFDATEQRLVLAHEDVHRRRLDNLWNLLAALLCALHWFNPLAWLALRGLRADQELACDAAVMRAHPGCEAPYSRALMAAQGGSTALLQPWARWNSSHPLIERIAMLDKPTPSRLRQGLGMALLGLIAAGTASAAFAWNAAETAAPARYVDLALDVATTHRNAAQLDRQAIKARVIVAEGKTAKVLVSGPDGDAAHALTIAIAPTLPEPGQVALSFILSEGDKVIARPRLLSEIGAASSIRTEPGEHGEAGYEIKVTATRASQDPEAATLKQPQ